MLKPRCDTCRLVDTYSIKEKSQYRHSSRSRSAFEQSTLRCTIKVSMMFQDNAGKRLLQFDGQRSTACSPTALITSVFCCELRLHVVWVPVSRRTSIKSPSLNAPAAGNHYLSSYLEKDIVVLHDQMASYVVRDPQVISILALTFCWARSPQFLAATLASIPLNAI